MPPEADDSTGSLYRGASVRALCSVCGELTGQACLRCGRPLCAAHEPAVDRRCDACEALFERRTRRWAAAATLPLQVAVALPFLITGRPSIDSARWIARVRRAARPRFLRERPRR